MNDRHAEAAGALRRAILATPGDLDPATREAIERWAASPDDSPPDGLPAAARTYLEKVARHAYKVVDADVEALKAAGWSEDAIFEATLAAAVGAARARLEAGLRALREEG